MATTGFVNGTLLRIYKGGTKIGYATSCSISFSMETRSTLTKDTPGNGWVENATGQKSFTLETEFIFSYDTPNVDPVDLFTDFNNRTPLVLRLTTDVAGDTYWEGTAYVTSYNISSPVEDNITCSATFTGTGAISTGTES
jgi:predicted secreted protein